MERDFKIGMTAYATHQGLGYLAKSFYDAGLVDEVLLVYHGSRPTHPEWYDDRAVPITQFPIAPDVAEEFLGKIDLFLCFETPFDWTILPKCRGCVATVCMPMYEWFPKERLDAFDGYLCPSLLDLDYFPKGKSAFFQPPVDPRTWKLRTRAERFLHNAGNVGHRWHKGTLELLQAVPHLKSDLRLTVRAQDSKEFKKVLKQVPEAARSSRLEVVTQEIPREELFASHDVYVAPEKFNGLSLPLQEARAAGLLVLTTDRYPANRWLPSAGLIPVERFHRACIGGSYLEFDEAEVNPATIAKCMDDWYGRDMEAYSRSGLAWAQDNSWDAKRDECIRLLWRFLCQ